MPDCSDGGLASISSASCKVTASYKTQFQLASILSDHEGVSNSSVSVKGEKRDKTSIVSIRLDPLELIKSNGTRWHEVFHRGVIAKDFPIPPTHGRNELIKEYLWLAYLESLPPGVRPDESMRRTTKQVSSHIQVLKAFLRDHPACKIIYSRDLTDANVSKTSVYFLRTTNPKKGSKIPSRTILA